MSNPWKESILALALFLGLAAVLFFITPPKHENPYNGPMIIAERILDGRSDMPEEITWMEFFTYKDRKYIGYPPMATLILVPYALVGGEALGQTVFNSGMILATAFLFFRIFAGIPELRPLRFLAPALYVLGTPVFFSAAVGSVWLLMHSEGNFFLAAAVLLAAVKRNFFWAGVGFMIAAQVRYVILFAAPAFALLALLQGSDWRSRGRLLLMFALGCIPPGLLVLTYNYLVFDDPFFVAYTTLWSQWDQAPINFSADHIWPNLVFYGTALPLFSSEAPWIRFPGTGQTLLFLSPFLWGVFFPRWRLPLVRAGVPALACMLLFYLCYSYQGTTQFGSRYLTDLFPLLIPVALSAFTRSSRAWYPLLLTLAAIAIVLNVYGTLTTAA